MTNEFFIKQVDRLRSVYGLSSINDERAKILWDEFKGLENSFFERVITNLIAEYTGTTLPALSKIKSIVTDNKSEERFTPIRRDEELDCSWCGQSGVVDARHRKTKYMTAFRCQCTWYSGRFKTNMAATWGSEYLQDYEPRFYDGKNPGENPQALIRVFSEANT